MAPGSILLTAQCLEIRLLSRRPLRTSKRPRGAGPFETRLLRLSVDLGGSFVEMGMGAPEGIRSIIVLISNSQCVRSGPSLLLVLMAAIAYCLDRRARQMPMAQRDPMMYPERAPVVSPVLGHGCDPFLALVRLTIRAYKPRSRAEPARAGFDPRTIRSKIHAYLSGSLIYFTSHISEKEHEHEQFREFITVYPSFRRARNSTGNTFIPGMVGHRFFRRRSCMRHLPASHRTR